MQIDITKLDHMGRGIGFIDNKIVFVPNTMPNDIVEIKITHDSKKFLEGEVVSFIKESEDRINPICKYYQECGGCDLLHMNYTYQLDYKLDKVKNILSRYAGIDSKLITKIISENEYNYRNKIVLQVDSKLGLIKRKSHDIVNIDHCYLVSDEVNAMISTLNKLDLTGITKIIIRYNQNEIMLIIETPLISDELINTFDCNIIQKIKDEYTIVKGNGFLKEKIDDLEFIISPNSFFQVNTKCMVKLYEQVAKYAKLTGKEVVLDLFCGTGTIGLFLAKHAKEVLGIEISSTAIDDALKNAEINKINNISFKVGDVDHLINELEYHPDVVVVDPPRSGLMPNTIDNIIKLNPSKLIYVSCDPITLARDIKLLATYEVVDIKVFDMFPNTYHVECVVNLKRK